MHRIADYQGNTYRFHQFFQKARKQKPVSLVFLGASVTMGFQIPEEDQFPVRIRNFLAGKYARTEFSLHNLSEPGLPSMHGLYQCYQNTEPLMPDLIVIDYSINDQKNADYREAYESLIAKTLSLPSEPAVMAFFVKGQGRAGYTCAPQMSAIHQHYGVPYTDIGASLEKDIADGLLVWEEYSYDDKHPSPEGHHYIASQIIRLLDSMESSRDMPYAFPETALFGRDLSRLSFLDAPWIGSRKTFPPSIEFTLSCQTLFLSYMVDVTPDMGQLTVEIDGVPTLVLDSYRIHEWDHPEYKIYRIRDAHTHAKKSHRFRLLADSGGHSVFHFIAFGYA